MKTDVQSTQNSIRIDPNKTDLSDSNEIVVNCLNPVFRNICSQYIIERCGTETFGYDKPVRYTVYFNFNCKSSDSAHKLIHNSSSSNLSDEELVRAVDDPHCRGYIKIIEYYSSRSLPISDLCKQQWCEQQVVFQRLYPFILTKDGQIRHINDKPEIRAGSQAHDRRESQIQRNISIRCFSRADRLAVELLNCIMAFSRILKSNQDRQNIRVCEVPVFGLWRRIPTIMDRDKDNQQFDDEDIYLKGVIDEIRLVNKGSKVQIVEFKTVSSNTLLNDKHKTESIKNLHMFQAKIYCDLLHQMVQDFDMPWCIPLFLKYQNVDGRKHLSSTITNLYASRQLPVYCLYDALRLFKVLIIEMKRILPVKQYLIEYKYLNIPEEIEKSLPTVLTFNYDKSWLATTSARDAFDFWIGKKPPKGVEIEECWKCNSCQYADKCYWNKDLCR
ncbi:hypothetical protein GJ496_006847 [Pomphorhynchus laevis]|nr:hypothetical protein GJ496_006847 [Pomphorhynchus laevis]